MDRLNGMQIEAGEQVAEEKQTRNTERTRRAVLDAATQLMLEKGAAITLAQVASAAGVSKSGLIHHFGSHDQLVVAVVEDVFRLFRDSVFRHLDLSENRPGKMLRAYVRTICSHDDAADDYSAVLMWTTLFTIPAAAAAVEKDNDWWTEQFALDGLSRDRILIVRRAAEGLSTAHAFGDENAESLDTALRLLLELTDEGTFSSPL